MIIAINLGYEYVFFIVQCIFDFSKNKKKRIKKGIMKNFTELILQLPSAACHDLGVTGLRRGASGLDTRSGRTDFWGLCLLTTRVAPFASSLSRKDA